MMRGFTLIELIIVITIASLLTLSVIPLLQRKFFSDKELLRAFIFKNIELAIKRGKVIEVYGDGNRLSSSANIHLDLPIKGKCYIYPDGEIRECWFIKDKRKVYYTVFDL